MTQDHGTESTEHLHRASVRRPQSPADAAADGGRAGTHAERGSAAVPRPLLGHLLFWITAAAILTAAVILGWSIW